MSASNGERRTACAFDLDALAYGELVGLDETPAREHVAVCVRCHAVHTARLREQRLFARRAHDAVDGRALPDVDALLLRATREPLGLVARVRPFAARWSAPVVGAFALLLFVHARRERGFEPALGPSVRVHVDRAAIDESAWGWGALPVSAEECVDATATCVCTTSSSAPVACAEPATAPASKVECSSTRDAALYLAADVDAVCAADAI